MGVKWFNCKSQDITGRSKCTLQQCRAACIAGKGCKPGPFMAVLQDNASNYNNAGTVSGSALYQECDAKPYLERHLDYAVEPDNLFYAAYRGQNIHDAHERVKNNPEFKDWLFEKRYFGIITPDGEVRKEAILTALGNQEEPDWPRIKERIADLREQGNVVLSGQVDNYDKKNGILWDTKTMSWVKEEVKDSWRHQLHLYRLLLELHGKAVNAIRINCMDAKRQVVIDVPLWPLDEWSKTFLVPRAKQLDVWNMLEKDDFAPLFEGRLEDAVAQGLPLPRVSFLCNGQNRSGTVYCPVRDQCPLFKDGNHYRDAPTNAKLE